MQSSKLATLFVFCLALTLLTPVAYSAEQLPHPTTYIFTPTQASKIIKMLDDPKNLIVTYPLKDAIPPEVY
ncbi:MAG: hypothetical protein JRJ20_15930, partial [Deltaproteobacteria bacterium]|nr:hypothetical protein [Deltaproteobacteria bacterium]